VPPQYYQGGLRATTLFIGSIACADKVRSGPSARCVICMDSGTVARYRSVFDQRGTYDLDIGLPVYWSGRLSPGNFRCPVRLATSPERSAVAAYRRSPLYLYQII